MGRAYPPRNSRCSVQRRCVVQVYDRGIDAQMYLEKSPSFNRRGEGFAFACQAQGLAQSKVVAAGMQLLQQAANAHARVCCINTCALCLQDPITKTEEEALAELRGMCYF